jgi:uncharacterized protein (DUF433 family)
MASIINNRIDGSRITVWDVYLYTEHGWSDEQIRGVLPISQEQLEAAKLFIEQNREYVHEGHLRIEERNARGNPPEIEEKLKQSRAKMQAWLAQRKEQASAGTAR